MNRPVYYNDNDPFAAHWLQNLVSAGLLPAGDVDDRSIMEVTPDDLRRYAQCHFFAGIGGWPYALELAGWPSNRPVWTGSCPCQPFSSAGKHQGHADDRHLWPAFFRLIAECRPDCIFGEQVGSKDGREWLAGVRADLETLGYACGGADLPAAGVAAPHIRARLYWVANAGGVRRQQTHSDLPGGGQRSGAAEHEAKRPANRRDGRVGRLGDAAGAGLEEREEPEQHSGQRVSPAAGADSGPGGVPGPAGAWDDSEWVWCTDGYYRRLNPAIRLLADGIPARMDKLRGLGNAVVPQVAAVFVQAVMECV